MACLLPCLVVLAGLVAAAAPAPLAPAALVWAGSPVPAIDLPFLLNQFTVPLGTVPVID